MIKRLRIDKSPISNRNKKDDDVNVCFRRIVNVAFDGETIQMGECSLEVVAGHLLSSFKLHLPWSLRKGIKDKQALNNFLPRQLNSIAFSFIF